MGTSLPELAASIASALKGQADMAIGAIVGSNMFNILLVLAIPGFWGDLSLEPEVHVPRLARLPPKGWWAGEEETDEGDEEG